MATKALNSLQLITLKLLAPIDAFCDAPSLPLFLCVSLSKSISVCCVSLLIGCQRIAHTPRGAQQKCDS